ncbi:MAG: hypothetical protein NTV36_02230, partial [Candidatus Staskawiczbacteria bacterium]|nr:hypothetical protein [Candidatus Staskawiczbacteria bacterium]
MKRLLAICLVAMSVCVSNAMADWIIFNPTGLTNMNPWGISGNDITASANYAGSSKYFLYDGVNWNMLTMPGADNINARGLDGNNMVGFAYINGHQNGFLYNGTTWTAINKPGATNTWFTDISG